MNQDLSSYEITVDCLAQNLYTLTLQPVVCVYMYACIYVHVHLAVAVMCLTMLTFQILAFSNAVSIHIFAVQATHLISMSLTMYIIYTQSNDVKQCS
jgi:hypothetical protein